ncbi:transposase [Rickettsiaceae bacterium]|nr:transposase [Rickettsiaceae bacterium]
MPASYSKDFRSKVMSYVKKGNSCNSASIKFEISANTVRNWDKRYKSEGHYLAKKVGGKKGRVTPKDIASYIETNPNFILSDMGKHFKMSAAGAHYWLKKLGYSYKKKISPTWKLAKKI